MYKIINSYFLSSSSSFISGFAKAIDLAATLLVFNSSDSAEEADSKATYADWAVIGNDLRGAMDEFSSKW